MAENVRQRRGKKSSGSTDTDGNGTQQPAPIDQLKNAQARLVVSRDRTADLHAAWKNQLFLLSLLIIMVTLHQLQSSISSCILEIKGSTNNNEGGEIGAVSGGEAIKIIFSDSFCEILGVAISSLLAYFLALAKFDSKLELDNWPYMVSSALVPICLSFYFHSSKQLTCTGENDVENSEDSSEKDPRHQFPAVVIYHTIVTVAFWFMKSGMKQCEDHVKLVTDSIRDFERMDKKLELKKKLKSQAARKK